MAVFKDAFEKGNMFASGIAVDYGASVLVAKPGTSISQGDGTDAGAAGASSGQAVVAKQFLAPGLPVGKRFASFKVLNQADARPWHFAERLPSDGRFRIVLFVGNMADPAQRQRVEALAAALDAPDGPLRRFTPHGAKVDSVIQLLTIHSAPREAVDIFDFPEVLRPYDEQKGWEYNSIFVDAQSYHEGHGRAYENYGVDAKRGCVVLVRPDQYVAYIGELEDVVEVTGYFETILVPAAERRVTKTANSGGAGREGVMAERSAEFDKKNEETVNVTARPLGGEEDLAM